VTKQFALLTAIALSVSVIAQPDDRPLELVVSLASGWDRAPRIRIELRDVEVAGDQEMKIRITAPHACGRETFLGSAGVLAMRPQGQSTQTIERIRVDVTRPLHRLSKSCDVGTSLLVRVEARDSSNRRVPDSRWKVGEVKLVPGK